MTDDEWMRGPASAWTPQELSAMVERIRMRTKPLLVNRARAHLRARADTCAHERAHERRLAQELARLRAAELALRILERVRRG